MSPSPEFEIFTLQNGLQVVHRRTNRPVAHCSVFIHAGTRDELENESGLAHFIEHALFKGTERRRAYHILNRLDSVGGEIDAYTTKELTCVYTSFLNEYYERAIELMADIILHSTFPEKELEKEKDVILDEILVYEDSPSDLVYDDFENQVYKGHALGRPILGTKESVKALSRSQIINYQARLYKAENIVISSVGNITTAALQKKLEKHFGKLSNDAISNQREGFHASNTVNSKVNKQTNQTHVMMGKSTIGLNDEKRIGMSLLNNLFGGPAMNTILNLKIREKYGYTYHLESNYTAYSDTGLFSIYMACDPKYSKRVIKAIEREIKLLQNKTLSSSKLHLAKQQLKGQLALSRENNTNLMLSYGKSLLTQGKISSTKEIHNRIDLISAADLQQIAQEELDLQEFHYLTYEGS